MTDTDNLPALLTELRPAIAAKLALLELEANRPAPDPHTLRRINEYRACLAEIDTICTPDIPATIIHRLNT